MNFIKTLAEVCAAEDTLLAQRADIDNLMDYTEAEKTLVTAPADWNLISELEPALKELEYEVLKIKKNYRGRDILFDYWYPVDGFKAKVINLAGDMARLPALRNSYCYDLAYEYLVSLLKD